MLLPSPDEGKNLPDDAEEKMKKMNGQLLDEMADSIALLQRLKVNVELVSNEIKSSFIDTRIMYWLTFLLGIALIAIAVPVALYTNRQLFSLLFGSAGVIDILAFFLKDPPQQLQKSRANLSKLQAAYYQWLTDTYNWSTVLFHQSVAGDLKVEDMKIASDSYAETFSLLMRAIDGDTQATGRSGIWNRRKTGD